MLAAGEMALAATFLQFKCDAKLRRKVFIMKTPDKFTDPVIDASIRSVAFLRFMSENSALKRLYLRSCQQLLQLWRKLLDCPGKNTR